MTKLTLDMNTFKALASDTRLDILRALDGKKMSLKDISRATKLNKATLHEHLAKLNEAGLVKKKEREGHKWVYYKLTWKGEGLLHPENTRIVVMFSATFISLFIAVIFIMSFLQPITVGMAETYEDTTSIYEAEGEGIPLFTRSYTFNYLGDINATEQTVGNITLELQSRAKSLKNSLGIEYKDEEIQWITPSNAQVYTDQLMLNIKYKDDYYKLDRDNNSINETNESKGIYDNGISLEFSPVVPEMIAIVQDPTLLYFAIICLTFFGVSFTLSTWRFWKNKTPKL
jgi:DNA-binding transcriptional ArsR family regulator